MPSTATKYGKYMQRKSCDHRAIINRFAPRMVRCYCGRAKSYKPKPILCTGWCDKLVKSVKTEGKGKGKRKGKRKKGKKKRKRKRKRKWNRQRKKKRKRKRKRQRQWKKKRKCLLCGCSDSSLFPVACGAPSCCDLFCTRKSRQQPKHKYSSPSSLSDNPDPTQFPQSQASHSSQRQQWSTPDEKKTATVITVPFD